MNVITIDKALCRKEGLCAKVCRKVFRQEQSGTVPEVSHPDLCHECGQCLLVCPTGALTHSRLRPAMTPVRPDLLPTYDQVREMIVTRRSTRAFLEQPVERNLIERIIEGARFAPSAKNTQSTRYTVVRDRGLLGRISSLTAAWLESTAKSLRNPLLRRLYLFGTNTDAAEVGRWIKQFDLIGRNVRAGNDMILFDAPVLILFHAARGVRFAEANANLAVQNATMVASSLGLGSFYTGYVVLACSRVKELAEVIKVTKNHRVYAGLALGHPAVAYPRWVERKPPEVTWL